MEIKNVKGKPCHVQETSGTHLHKHLCCSGAFREKKKKWEKGKKVNQTMKLILIFTLHVKESSNKWLFSKRFGLHLWWTTLPHIWITIIVSYLEHLHHWFYATKSFHFNVYSIILKIIIFNWKQFNAIKILRLWLGYIRNNIVNSKYFKLIFFLVIGDFRSVIEPSMTFEKLFLEIWFLKICHLIPRDSELHLLKGVKERVVSKNSYSASD